MDLEDTSIVKVKYNSGTSDEPDVANGAPIQLYVTENRDTFGKDTSFITIPKPAASRVEEPETLALDFKESDNGFNISGFIRMGNDNRYSLPSVFRDSNDNGVVSGADDPDATITTVEQLSFTEFGNSGNPNTHSWHLLGAMQIEPSSFILEDADGNSLSEGTDYNVEYNKGLIEIFDNNNINKDANGDPDETLQAGYKYRGRNDTVARLLKRMAERGGPLTLEVDPNTFANPSRNINAVDQTNDFFTIADTVGSDYVKGDVISVSGSSGNDGEYNVVKAVEPGGGTTDVYVEGDIPSGTADGAITKKEGLKYMAHAETVEIVQNPGNPNIVEVTLDLRKAVDKQ